jgi:hypothetical protein
MNGPGPTVPAEAVDSDIAESFYDNKHIRTMAPAGGERPHRCLRFIWPFGMNLK